jgi:hypothetical protein
MAVPYRRWLAKSDHFAQLFGELVKALIPVDISVQLLFAQARKIGPAGQ